MDVEDWAPLKRLYLLNGVCRICGKKGSLECSRCKIEEMRQNCMSYMVKSLRNTENN